MADFMQAIKWLKEGKKVRRKGWEPNYFLLKRGVIYWDDGQEPNMDLERYEATDWGIFEEEETLSDKEVDMGCYTTSRGFLLGNVIGAIRKLKKDLEEIRKKFISDNSLTHFVNYNYKNWNCPTDGLDYALHKIDKYMGPKLT